jgi:hypothetical protein
MQKPALLQPGSPGNGDAQGKSEAPRSRGEGGWQMTRDELKALAKTIAELGDHELTDLASMIDDRAAEKLTDELTELFEHFYDWEN